MALFLHICGVVALFSVIALLLGAMAGARRASSTQAVHEWARMAGRMRWVLPFAAVWLWAAAAYMVSDRWHWDRPWISAAMALVVLVVAIHVLLVAPRFAAMADATAGSAAAPQSVAVQLMTHDPILWIGGQTMSTVATGVIALMVFKPDGRASLLISLVAVGLGLLSGVPSLMRRRRLATKSEAP